MDDYEIVFARTARKELESLAASLVQRVFSRIEALANEPRPRGARKLSGTDSLYRLRVGDYRVIYEIVAVRHRRDAYR